jgi:hypothetical protein
MKFTMIRRVFFVLVALPLTACGRDTNTASTDLTFTTTAYKQEAKRLVIEEANRVAKELNLPEPLPITEASVVESFIPPPRIAQGMKSVGTITTSNYFYGVSVGKKFSCLNKTRSESEYPQLQRDYLWPMAKMDTNGAFQLATQWLNAISVDVQSLNRDCPVIIRAWTPEGKKGAHFVPVYWVVWANKPAGEGSVASVELFAPTKTIRQLAINDSKYILRNPLVFTNLTELLSQSNAPATNSGLTPPK